jgi:hypothetical protein
MSTAVTTSSPEDSRGGSNSSGPAQAGGWSVYKPGEGHATRLGLMVVVLAYVVFASRQWYYNWVFIPKFFRSLGLGFFLDWTDSFRDAGVCGLAGRLLLHLRAPRQR